MRFGYLALFAAGGGLGDGGGFGAASGFDTFGCCGTGGFFGLTQSTLHGGVCVFCLMSAGSLRCLTRGGLRGSGGCFGLGLGQQCLFANLLGGTMPQLRAIFPSRRRKVTILRSVKVRPGVEDGHIFGRLCDSVVDLVRAARIHFLVLNFC